jgi:hypothetical protein
MEASRELIERARRVGRREGAARTIAQSFCLLIGAGLITVGVLGFVFGGSGFDVGGDVQGDDLIIFEVNGWHNVVHIATGAFLVVISVRPAAAAIGALSLALSTRLSPCGGSLTATTSSTWWRPTPPTTGCTSVSPRSVCSSAC